MKNEILLETSNLTNIKKEKKIGKLITNAKEKIITIFIILIISLVSLKYAILPIECMERDTNPDGISKIALEAIQDNNEEMTRVALSLMRRIDNVDEMSRFLNFLEQNNIQNPENSFQINNTGHVENAGEIPQNNITSYILAGIGVIIIGGILWTHRNIFIEFFYNITQNSLEMMTRSAQRYIENANEEEIIRIINYFNNGPMSA